MLSVREVRLNVLNMRTRMPFRYGIASMTALPHLFVRIEADVNGKPAVGLAAEGLPPKWFTKDPATTFRQDLADMLGVIRHACDAAIELPAAATVFAWWRALYDAQMAWGADRGYAPLLTGLGASLVERALLDAVCRATAMPFPEAVRVNALGIHLAALHAELSDIEPGFFLPSRPLRRIVVRHTVGLADPLTDADISPGERLEDGLPQSLEACVAAYGLTHFKIKLSGDLPKDIARLRQVAVVLDARALDTYRFTLDGNEQYASVTQFCEAWSAFAAEPSLRGFMPHALFVEQPLHRGVALSDDAARELRAWRDRPAIIIDESDGEAGSAAAALERGYAGTSHKNCKGVFRGVANACLIAKRRREQPQRRFVLSGEDLANVGPIALLQDLATMATLGVEHVERNGHHYFRGLSMLPENVQSLVLEKHGDLYRRHDGGFPTLDVRAGRIEIDSVVEAPFGTRFLLDSMQFTPLEDWRFESLGVQE
ncbi:MAG TPA: hypothetical protein VFX49_01295 [Chloroflexota bacterium]|nr:hypothetical protein [Chloroflexota bacterium]